MAIVTTDNKNYQAIAEKVREFKGTQETMLPSEMPLKIQEVYDVGYEKGVSDAGDITSAYEQGYADGKQAQNEEFWNEITINETRKDYEYAFYGSGWTDISFNPSRVLKPEKAVSMFQKSNINERLYTDNLDFSACVNMQNCFIDNTKVKRLKKIDARKVKVGWNGMHYAFMKCSSLESIDEFYPPDTAKLFQTFNSCSSLKHIAFMSDIKTSDLNLSACILLDKASITSAVTHLSDSASGLGVTLSQTAVNREFETSEGANDGSTSEEWLNLIATKNNWTISLV